MGIVGESGSGKSTLGNANVDVLKLTAPDVKMREIELTDQENIELLSEKQNEKNIEAHSNDFPRSIFIFKSPNAC